MGIQASYSHLLDMNTILSITLVIGFTTGATHGEACCKEKIVGGIKYRKVGEENTSKYGCQENCVYEKTNSSTSAKYCFAPGDLEVECGDNGNSTKLTPLSAAELAKLHLTAPTVNVHCCGDTDSKEVCGNETLCSDVCDFNTEKNSYVATGVGQDDKICNKINSDETGLIFECDWDYCANVHTPKDVDEKPCCCYYWDIICWDSENQAACAAHGEHNDCKNFGSSCYCKHKCCYLE